ncbi:MAG: ribonuclease H family protein [Saprospiraceae bacterium]
MAKKKFYVVWQGHRPGIYQTWGETEAQVNGFPNALFKGFPTKAAAEAALAEGPPRPGKPARRPTADTGMAFGIPRRAANTSGIVKDSISVDAACSGNPGVMEYQGVLTDSGEQIFHQKFPLGTNNIGEFLAIIHALALLQKQGRPNLPIYTDSRIAMGWIGKGKCKTTLIRNARTQKLHEMIERGETWLKNNEVTNPILKWETKRWGEIPADFGRK